MPHEMLQSDASLMHVQCSGTDEQTVAQVAQVPQQEVDLQGKA